METFLVCLHQVLGRLLTLSEPLIKHLAVPRLEPNLEVLWLHGQACGDGICLEAVHDRLIPRVHRRRKPERQDQSYKCSEEFPVC